MSYTHGDEMFLCTGICLSLCFSQDSVVSRFICTTIPWTIISILIEMETETP